MADTVKLVALERLVHKGEFVEAGDEFTVDAENAEGLLDEEQENGPKAAKPGSKAASQADAGKPNASKSAQKKAKALDVDLATVTGTGKDGAITVKDVENAADAAA